MQKTRIEVPNPLTMDICNQLVEVQRKAWLMPDADILPAWKIFVTPQIGGHVIVAFEDHTPVGFAYLTHAVEPGKSAPYLYLDMLGVSSESHSHGIGYELMQRAIQLAKEKGYSGIKWTYDPLEGANGNLYIRKLGGIVTKYYEDYYGQLTGKRHKASASDRFWTELALDAKPFQGIAEVVISESNAADLDALIKKGTASIAVSFPNTFQSLRDNDPDAASRVRLSIRHTFQKLLAAGYVIRGFEKRTNDNIYTAVK